jgi:nitrogen regulatory protein PII
VSKCAHITIVIHISLLKDLLSHLELIGINQLYSSFGRSLSICRPKKIAGLFSLSNLQSEPVELLNFSLPLEHEALVMKSIIRFSRLDIPGRGSIYSKIIEDFSLVQPQHICQINTDKIIQDLESYETPLFKKLSLINCTIIKGLADDIAYFLLHLGIVPVITNASGTGLRDQLGLLRITIPKEKEFISIVVPQEEASNIMENMIGWGRIDRPGRGFIWKSPVSMGLVNFKASQQNIGHAASIEQMIAAIDSLKGNLSWRQGASSTNLKSNRAYFGGHELFMQVKEGNSSQISKEIAKLGISGATVQPLRTLTSDNNQDNIVVPQEILKVVVTPLQLGKIKEALTNPDHILHQAQIRILPVPRAFNFKRPK